jgi:ferredoxin
MNQYRVEIDTEACDGIFACLTRDPRFVEDDDGLVTIDPTADPVPPEGYNDGDSRVRRENGRIVAEFEDNRIDEAQQAAVACPMNAITVNVGMDREPKNP